MGATAPASQTHTLGVRNKSDPVHVVWLQSTQLPSVLLSNVVEIIREREVPSLQPSGAVRQTDLLANIQPSNAMQTEQKARVTPAIFAYIADGRYPLGAV